MLILDKTKSLDDLKRLENNLELARIAQIKSGDKQTSLKIKLEANKHRLFELKLRLNRLTSTLRDRSIAKSRKRKSENADENKAETSYITDQDNILDEIEEVHKLIEAQNESIKKLLLLIHSCNKDYEAKVDSYYLLKTDFNNLIKDNKDWEAWSKKRDMQIQKLVTQVELPEKHLKTVVIKCGKNKSLLLYYGNINRVYSSADKCYIIYNNGDIYFKYDENNLELVSRSPKPTERA